MARPSAKWFPLTLTERAVWYSNFNRVLQGTGAGLGLTAGDLAVIQSDCDMLVFLARTMTTLEAYVSGVQNYKKHVTEGKPGSATPQFPADIAFVPPAVTDAGIFDRLTRFVARIRASARFTEETAAELKIQPTLYLTRPDHLEHGARPELALSPETGSIVRVKFVRGGSSGITIQMQVDNEKSWIEAGIFMKSPAEIAVPKSEGNLPRLVKVRARFRHFDDTVGDWSPVATTQTIP